MAWLPQYCCHNIPYFKGNSEKGLIMQDTKQADCKRDFQGYCMHRS